MSIEIRFRLVQIRRLLRPLHHAPALSVGPLSRLDIIPMLDGLVARVKQERFKANSPGNKVVFGMSKVVAVLKDSDDTRGLDLEIRAKCVAKLSPPSCVW